MNNEFEILKESPLIEYREGEVWVNDHLVWKLNENDI